MSTPGVKTYDRIVEESLALFNQQGERNITTNHIAAHLGISPGNLYYHFRNKEEIISQIFLQYRAFFAERFTMINEQALTLEDLANYLDTAFEAMWRFRFMFYDLPNLLARDPKLQADYHSFVDNELADILNRMFRGLVQFGLLKMGDDDIAPLITNIWLVAKYWFSFLQSAKPDTPVTEADSRRGTHQVLMLLKPYVQPNFQAQFAGLISRATTGVSK